MAQRRMFSKKITDTDTFLDMPLSSQALYFHLNMHADDDGFVSNAKTIRRMTGASEDDLKILLAKQFIFSFESGVVVIKDWKIHNYIRKDTYNDTIYNDEKGQLLEDKNGAYTFRGRLVDGTSPQVRLGKDRLGKDNKDNGPTFVEPIPPDQPRKTKSKKEPKHYAVDSDQYKLAAHLLERIIGNNPDYEKEKLAQTAYRERKLQKWADVMRLMIKNDKHTPQQIKQAIDWAQDNDFWWANILSAEKLRKQYGTLQSQAIAERKTPHAGGKQQVRESLPDWAQDGYQHKSKQVDPKEAAQIKDKLRKMKMEQQIER